MMRLINDYEAPNLQLMYRPELDVARGILPRLPVRSTTSRRRSSSLGTMAATMSATG